MADHYLLRCLRQFEEVSQSKYGKPFNLKAIENEVRGLRESRRKLRVSDLNSFQKEEHWWFKRYWVLPSSVDVASHLEDKTFNFHQLSRGNEGTPREHPVINELLSAFRSIELVSIILRFIRPDSFGILSPPVERVLDVRRGSNAVEIFSRLERIRRRDKRHSGAAWCCRKRCRVRRHCDAAALF